MTELVDIPEPKGWPIFGNALDIDPNFPLGALDGWADEFGEIYRIRLPGENLIVINSQRLVHEVCDETRFEKVIESILGQVRNGVRDGLFTAHNYEPNWGLAHRVLMPAFGPMPIQNMFSEMHEIATQLALKWARHGSGAPIMVTDDFTRLTLDTLALCAMGFRFNSFYHDEMHPFINAMGDYLTESGVRAQQPRFVTSLKHRANKKYWKDIGILRQTARDVVESRQANPTDRKDLLSAMLDGVDPKTGHKLSEDSIIDNLITFLIAGHETTSGMLSFAFYQLIKHPEKYRKAQKEVDDVAGTGPIKAEHMNKLPYITAVLRETLRLSPTISGFGLKAKKDEVIGGKYLIKKEDIINVHLSKCHLDRRVFGDTAEDFIPERMIDENFERLSKELPDFWKPFGNGMRGCIGRPFAWQEALIVMAVLLQNFDFVLDDPSYVLEIKQTLTSKPKDLYMRAALRRGMTPTTLAQHFSGEAPKANGTARNKSPSRKQQSGKPMSIYYGSNTGTCESLAQRLASDANFHGFEATIVEPLDAAKEKVPKDQPAVIITASYEGQPPDNAAEFVRWLEGLNGAEMEKSSFAVFGCGHKDWAQTFHRVPSLVDTTLEARGGSRICAMGLADAAKGEMFTEFEQWEDDVFWPAMEEKYGLAPVDGDEALAPSLAVSFSTPRSSVLRQDVKEAVVLEARSLSGPEKEKKHIEIQLPTGVTYRAGDYLAVLPVNPLETVNRVMKRFHLARDANITIAVEGRTTLPTDAPIPVVDILGSYVELGILTLAEATSNPSTKQALLSLSGPSYTEEISKKRVSVLDLLERFPAVSMPFAAFLSLLPPMRVRQYSISSSPLMDSSRATLTYSVISEPSLANPNIRHVGVASSYLASLTAGDKLNVSIRQSHAAFHLPENPAETPIVCIAAGAGLAPFRGFIQERAAQIAAGRKLAEAILYFGCRKPGGDDLYREEFDRWEKLGAVSVRRAYSRAEADEANGCRYVQDRMWHDRKELEGLWEKGVKIYVCGSRGVGENVKKAVIKIAMEMQRGLVERGESTEEPNEQTALRWFEGIRGERYATDVFD
ncbi:hypothetical protein OQA88_2162 [Cercophora sp. LCS_1]